MSGSKKAAAKPVAKKAECHCQKNMVVDALKEVLEIVKKYEPNAYIDFEAPNYRLMIGGKKRGWFSSGPERRSKVTVTPEDLNGFHCRPSSSGKGNYSMTFNVRVYEPVNDSSAETIFPLINRVENIVLAFRKAKLKQGHVADAAVYDLVDSVMLRQDRIFNSCVSIEIVG